MFLKYDYIVVFGEILFCLKDLLLKVVDICVDVYMRCCLFVMKDVSLGCDINVVEDVFL